MNRRGARIGTRRGERGVTLLELMVVVAIVGVLSAIAYPSYLSYLQRGNRSDATRALMLYGQAMERCYSQVFTYVGCAAVPAVTTPTPSPNRYYTVTLTAATATDYTITAVPAGSPQISDTLCTSFTLSGSAGQSATGAAPNPSQFCWGAN